jgi:hypothetical protein
MGLLIQALMILVSIEAKRLISIIKCEDSCGKYVVLPTLSTLREAFESVMMIIV